MAESSKPIIALTFDDGPNTTITPLVLDKLEKYGITASFFVVGSNINEQSACVMKRAYDMGCEIDSHSFTHSPMNQMTAEEIRQEIKETAERIYENIGEHPKFFRPPYIAINEVMRENIEMPFICGYGAEDWDNSVTADMRAEKVLSQAKDGAIMLLHDMEGNYQTVEALDDIIVKLQKSGYRFVTVKKLFKEKGVIPRADKFIVYSFAEQETEY